MQLRYLHACQRQHICLALMSPSQSQSCLFLSDSALRPWLLQPATSSTAMPTCAALLLDTILKLFSAATPLWKSGRWPLAAAAPPPVARHKCSLQAVANNAVAWHWLDCKSSIFKFPH